MDKFMQHCITYGRSGSEYFFCPSGLIGSPEKDDFPLRVLFKPHASTEQFETHGVVVNHYFDGQPIDQVEETIRKKLLPMLDLEEKKDQKEDPPPPPPRRRQSFKGPGQDKRQPELRSNEPEGEDALKEEVGKDPKDKIEKVEAVETPKDEVVEVTKAKFEEKEVMESQKVEVGKHPKDKIEEVEAVETPKDEVVEVPKVKFEEKEVMESQKVEDGKDPKDKIEEVEAVETPKDEVVEVPKAKFDGKEVMESQKGEVGKDPKDKIEEVEAVETPKDEVVEVTKAKFEEKEVMESQKVEVGKHPKDKIEEVEAVETPKDEVVEVPKAKFDGKEVMESQKGEVGKDPKDKIEKVEAVETPKDEVVEVTKAKFEEKEVMESQKVEVGKHPKDKIEEVEAVETPKEEVKRREQVHLEVKDGNILFEDPYWTDSQPEALDTSGFGKNQLPVPKGTPQKLETENGNVPVKPPLNRTSKGTKPEMNDPELSIPPDLKSMPFISPSEQVERPRPKALAEVVVEDVEGEGVEKGHMRKRGGGRGKTKKESKHLRQRLRKMLLPNEGRKLKQSQNLVPPNLFRPRPRRRGSRHLLGRKRLKRLRFLRTRVQKLLRQKRKRSDLASVVRTRKRTSSIRIKGRRLRVL